MNRNKRELRKLAYRELEFVGEGTRVPDAMGVLRTLEGTWDEDDDVDESARIVVVVVSGGGDVTNKVVVVVKDGGSRVIIVGGEGAEWRRLGEYMRR